ncbi:MAG: MFS transporter, partial [Actinobacteria bacterium]|nr:MFS transporter [Actinomycetota bacterium]
MMFKKPDWPYTLLAHALFLQLATFVVRPAASYRAIELGVNPGLIGLIAASFAFLPLFAAVVIGRASDSGHNSAILIIGSTILIVAGFGFILFAHSVISLIILNLLLGLGHLMSVIGQQSKVAQGDNSTLDSAFGLYTFAGSVGQTLGPVLIVIFGGDRIIPDTG